MQDNWLETQSGLSYPPQRAGMGERQREELREELFAEFDGALSQLFESIDSQNPGRGAGLGVENRSWEDSLGDSGWGSGNSDESLRLLAERISSTPGTLYGSEFGFGYGTGSGQQFSDIVRHLSYLIWQFPQLNPLIKQMVELRGLYVFGQGFEVRGESKRKKAEAIRAMQEKRAEMEAQADAQQMMMGAAQTGDESGATDGKPASGMDADALADNALMQRNGASGQASSAPGPRAGRQNPRRESLDEARSPASGTGSGDYRTIMGESESRIAKVIREFWDDPCNRDRLTSVEALQRLDKQCMVEGNAFVVVRQREGEEMPTCSVLPTYAIHSIIVDDLDDGTGITLGFLMARSAQGSEQATGAASKTVIPSMVADNVERLRRVLQARTQFDDLEIDDRARCLHLKEWGPPWRPFGLPGIMASLNSATRYMSFTSEWVIMQRVWRTYAMLVQGSGNNKGLTQIQSQFASRIAGLFAGTQSGQAMGGLGQTPPVGLAALSGMSPTGLGGTRIEPIRTAGSTDPPAMGREIRLLAEMGTGYPDNMFSDTNTGTMSRADVLERNTHLKFLSAQQNYGEMMKTISRCVVKMQLGDGALKDTDVVVTWPAIVTPSAMEQAGTLIQLYQGDGLPKRLYVEEALKLLKRNDLHEVMQVLFPADGDGMELYSDSQQEQMLAMGAGAGGPMGPGGGSAPPIGEAELDGFPLWDVETLLG